MKKKSKAPRACFRGSDFKALVAAATRFPSIGSFADSQMVHLKVSDGVARATMCSIAAAAATVPAEGELPLLAIEERTLQGFASVVSDAAKVYIQAGADIRMWRKGREVTVPLKQGTVYKIPKATGAKIKLSADSAKRIGFLSSIAYDDQSKAELSCVMLTKEGYAYAVNQKTIAALKCEPCSDDRVALPVPISRVLSKNDVLYPGKETLLRSGRGLYCMPSPLVAQKKFPLKEIRAYADLKRKAYATFDGSEFAEAVQESNSCLGQLSRVEVIAQISVEEDHIELVAESGGAIFRATHVPVEKGIATTFKISLEELTHVAAFLGKKTVLSRGDKGQVFLSSASGWAMMQVWTSKKK